MKWNQMVMEMYIDYDLFASHSHSLPLPHSLCLFQFFFFLVATPTVCQAAAT